MSVLFNNSTCFAPSPLQPACNSTLNYYRIKKCLPSISEIVNCNPLPVSCLNNAVYVVIQLVLLNSMRCSELLNITVNDLLKPSIFLVRGLKKSYSYSITIPMDRLNQKILSVMPKGTRLFPFTYTKVYRSMKAAGLGIDIPTRINQAVTHRSRYELASKLSLLNERENVTPLLHHKSPRTKEFYCQGSK